MVNLRAQSWRGYDGEDKMSQEDWILRGHEQAMAMANCLDPFLSSPDADGDPTGGVYEGDYPDSWHQTLNQRLDTDEQYADKTREDIGLLCRADLARRESQDSL